MASSSQAEAYPWSDSDDGTWSEEEDGELDALDVKAAEKRLLLGASLSLFLAQPRTTA